MAQETVGKRFPARIRRWVTRAHKLDSLESHPLLVGGAVKAAVLEHLTEERDDALRAVLVHVGQVDLVAEKDEPFVDLQRGEDDAVGSPTILAVMVEGLEQQLGRSRRGEIETDNFEVGKSAQS